MDIFSKGIEEISALLSGVIVSWFDCGYSGRWVFRDEVLTGTNDFPVVR